MNVTINNKNITLKYSFRAMMIYEKLTGTSFNPVGVTEIIIYFYSTVLASDKNIALTFDEFTEWLDSEPMALNEFSTWLTTTVTKNSVLNDRSEESNIEDSDLKKN